MTSGKFCSCSVPSPFLLRSPSASMERRGSGAGLERGRRKTVEEQERNRRKNECTTDPIEHLVIVGYGAGKLAYLDGDFDRQLSRLVINLTCPALILSSAMTGELPDREYILPLLMNRGVILAISKLFLPFSLFISKILTIFATVI